MSAWDSTHFQVPFIGEVTSTYVKKDASIRCIYYEVKLRGTNV